MEEAKRDICSRADVAKLIAKAKKMPVIEREEQEKKLAILLSDILAIAEKTMEKSAFTSSRNSIQRCLKKGPVQKRKLLSYCEELAESTEKKYSANEAVPQTYRTSGKQSLKRESLRLFYVEAPSKKTVDVDQHAKRLHSYDIEAISERAKLIQSKTRATDFANAVDFIITKRKETDRRFSNVRVSENARMSIASYNRAKQGEDTKPQTVWQIIFGLHCDEEEAETLMEMRGYQILRNDRFDAVLMDLLRKGYYELEDVNEVLAASDLKNKLFSLTVSVKDETSGAEKQRKTRPKKGREPKEK